MPNKARATADLIVAWKAKLRFAADDAQRRQVEADEAVERLGSTVRAAFAAGLTVHPIAEELGLTASRVYQIKRGVRT
jgi:hypothetical protein